jgi:CrcB protein
MKEWIGKVWSRILLLGVGGFIGSNLRYWISNWAAAFLGSHLPYGTLIVNGAGSFILGFLTLYGTEIINLDPRIRILIGTGMMGALTTFSTFSLETINLIRESNYYLALLNVMVNVGVGLIAVWIGFAVAKSLA